MFCPKIFLKILLCEDSTSCSAWKEEADDDDRESHNSGAEKDVAVLFREIQTNGHSIFEIDLCAIKHKKREIIVIFLIDLSLNYNSLSC